MSYLCFRRFMQRIHHQCKSSFFLYIVVLTMRLLLDSIHRFGKGHEYFVCIFFNFIGRVFRRHPINLAFA